MTSIDQLRSTVTIATQRLEERSTEELKDDVAQVPAAQTLEALRQLPVGDILNQVGWVGINTSLTEEHVGVARYYSTPSSMMR